MSRLLSFLLFGICASSQWLEAQHEIVLPTRRAAQRAPTSLPSLPSGSEQIAPVTIDVRDGSPRKIFRTVDRILVTSGQREWLFERNRIDTRRVTASVVEHAEKTIVLYGESDVRNLLGLNGWAEVLAATSETNQPTMSVQAGVDEQVLRPCRTRFPDYKVIDVTDWLEGR